MANEDTAAKAAGEAARIEAETQTRAVVENVTVDAAAAIAAAQAETARANAAAAELAQAAMQTQLGQRIQQNEERDAQWRSQLETQVTETRSALTQMSSLLEKLSAPAVPPSSLNPQPLPEPPAVVIQPNQNGAAENPAASTNHEPPRPKKVRL